MADFPASIEIKVKSREALQRIVELEKKLADVIKNYEIGITKVSKSYAKIVEQGKLIANSQKEINRELLRTAKIEATISKVRSARIEKEKNQRATNQSGGLGPALPSGRIFGPTQDFAGQAAEAARRTAIANARQLVQLRLNEARALRAQGGIQQGLNNLSKAQLEVARDIAEQKGIQADQDRVSAKFAERKAAADKRSADANKEATRTSKLQAKAGAQSVKDARQRLLLNRQITRERFRQLDAANKASQQAKQNRLQNAALGVGFPLLFGGGAGSILGGGLGAAGGFGGSVIGSAIGAQFDKIVSSAAKLGQALNPLTADIDAVITAAGLAGTEAQILISDIDEVSGEFAALSAAAALLGDQIGDEAVQELRDFGDGVTELGNSLSLAFTNIAVSITKSLNPALDELNKRLDNARLQGIGERIISEGGPDAERILAAGREDALRIPFTDIPIPGTAGGAGLEGLERQRDVIREILKEREQAIRDGASTESIDEQLRIEKELLDAKKEKYRVIQQIERQDAEAARQRERDAAKAEAEAKRIAEAARRVAEEWLKVQQRVAQLAINLREVTALTPLQDQLRGAQRDDNFNQQDELKAQILGIQFAAERERIEKSNLTDQEKSYQLLILEQKAIQATNNLKNDIADREADRVESLEKLITGLENETALLQTRGEKARELLKIEQQIAQLKLDGKITNNEEETRFRRAAQDRLAAQEASNKLLEQTKELNQLYGGIGDQLTSGLVDGLLLAVQGTEDLGTAFKDLAADILLSIGRALLLKAITSGFNAIGGDDGQGIFSALTGTLTSRVNGGQLLPGQPAIVGEKGAELFIPGKSGTVVPADVFEASRQAIAGNGPAGGDSEAFAQNSIALGNSASITKENTLVREMGMRENEPIDVRYESTVINNVSYVSEEQFQKGLKTAVAQSKSAVFSDLKNKPSSRAGIGLR